MNSSILKLNFKDISKGFVLVVLIVVLEFILNLLKTAGLDLTLDSFSPLLDLIVKAGGAYFLKNLFSTEDGKFLGKIG